jgi:radical SAM superfamily enzyme YgiQ (UPF0313 family)
MRIALFEAFEDRKTGRVFNPLGLGYLTSYLMRKIPEAEVSIFQDLEEGISWEPDLAGISCMSPTFPAAREMASVIKAKTGIPLILGGPHISALPRTLPEEFSAGVLGEGEETFGEIVSLLDRGQKMIPETLEKIPGLVFRDGEKPVLSPPRPLIEPLDSIPHPWRLWKGFDPNTTWIFTSRGCPYSCRFCFSSHYWKKCRFFSPGYVAEEIRLLVERHGLLFLVVMDDLFAIDPRRLTDIRYEMQGLPPLNLVATIRAELATEELCLILRSMGVAYVQLGLESGSDRVLKYLKGDSASVSGNQLALDLCRKHDISAVASFIIGSPGETPEDLEATCRFIEENLASGKLKSFTFGPLVPFPGTPLWDEAVSRGLIDLENLDWTALDIDLRTFDLSRYMLLDEALTLREFEIFFNRLQELSREIFKRPAAEKERNE